MENNLIFEEQAEYERGFAPFFEKEIKAKLLNLEKMRLEYAASYEKRMIAAILLGAVIFFSGIIFLQDLQTGFEIQLFMMIAAGLGFWVYQPWSYFRSQMKQDIVKDVVKFFGDFTYAETKNWNFNSPLLPSHSKSTVEDYIKGTYHDVEVEMSELLLKHQSGKNEHVVFQGQVLCFSMNKSFHGETRVVKDQGSMINWISKQASTLEKVALEDPTFESHFEVYSSDQVEARYLLTTAFMERLLNLQKVYNASDTLQCRFSDRTLQITIPSNVNLFEPGSLYTSCLQTDDVHRFLAQMHEIFSIIDILKLYSKTGL